MLKAVLTCRPLVDIMGMNLFIPTDDTKELGCTPDDIEV